MFPFNIAYNVKGLAFVGELAFRQPITKANDCNIADVLFMSQIYNVEPKLKHQKEQVLRQYSSSPIMPNLMLWAVFCRLSFFFVKFYKSIFVNESNFRIYKR